MNWNITDLAFVLFISAQIVLIIAIQSWKYRPSHAATNFSHLMVFIYLWTVFSCFELIAKDLSYKVLWSKMSYFGIAFVAPAWFIFALTFEGKYLKRGVASFWYIWIFPALTLILCLTNDYHHLIWTDTVPYMTDHGMLVKYQHGIAIWVYSIYSYILILIGSVLLIRKAFLYKGNILTGQILLILATLIPWISNIFYMFRVGVFQYYDLTPVGFSITGILLILAVFQFSLFDLIPHANRNLFNSTSIGVIIVNESGFIIGINPSAEKILRKSRIEGLRIDKVLDIQLVDKYKDFSNLNVTEKFIIDGDVKYYEINISPLKRFNGKLKGRLIQITDVTEKKLTEIEIFKSREKLKKLNLTKDKLFSIISHDMRNAFHNSGNILEIILQEDDLNKPINRSLLNDLLKNSENTYLFLQNLLEWSKIQVGEIPFHPNLFYLKEIVEKSSEIQMPGVRKKNLKIQCGIPQSTTVYGDWGMLMSVFGNLLSNAVKFSLENETIKIDATQSDETTTIIFKDNGVGMNKNQLEKLFQVEENKSTRGTHGEQGSGLGMVLVNEFVEKNEGTIKAESNPGNGTTIILTFPSKLK